VCSKLKLNHKRKGLEVEINVVFFLFFTTLDDLSLILIKKVKNNIHSKLDLVSSGLNREASL